jgi:hypothetical protein
VLRPAGELQRRRGVGLARGQPASHFPGVVQLIWDGGAAIVARDGVGVLRVGVVDEFDGCGVVRREGREGVHFAGVWWW